MTDAQIARAQWLAQTKAIKRSRAKIERALPKTYAAAFGRWQSTGAVAIPVDAQRDLAAVITATWRDAIKTGVQFTADQDKAAFTFLERKEVTLFEQIMMDFIQRYGAIKVVQILETTRNQIQRIVDKGVKEGLGQEAIAKQITTAIPSLSRTRARVIARTETHSAAMYASIYVARESPFPMNKRWISVYDARTRDFGEGDGVVDMANHRAMHEVTIPIDELFQVPRKGGGYDLMDCPGDPSAPAYQIINDRCGLVYRRAGRPWPKSGEA
jgi:hypothetical protein